MTSLCAPGVNNAVDLQLIVFSLSAVSPTVTDSKDGDGISCTYTEPN